MSSARLLTAEDLLAGTAAVHDVTIPALVLHPTGDGTAVVDEPGVVRLRPLTVSTLVLVSRAARDDPSLVPLLLVKESMVEPAMSLDQLRGLHAGLVHFLVAAVHTISGLTETGDVLDEATTSPLGQVQVLLAKHFGWSPEQVGRLTPGQVAVYLAGVDNLLRDHAARAGHGVERGTAVPTPATEGAAS